MSSLVEKDDIRTLAEFLGMHISERQIDLWFTECHKEKISSYEFACFAKYWRKSVGDRFRFKDIMDTVNSIRKKNSPSPYEYEEEEALTNCQFNLCYGRGWLEVYNTGGYEFLAVCDNPVCQKRANLQNILPFSEMKRRGFSKINPRENLEPRYILPEPKKWKKAKEKDLTKTSEVFRSNSFKQEMEWRP